MTDPVLSKEIPCSCGRGIAWSSRYHKSFCPRSDPNVYKEPLPSKERIKAIAAANRLLDCPFADPDDDERIVARQFLREIERATYRELTPAHEPCALSPEAQLVLVNAAQLIDGIKNTAPQDWTEWDQQVRDSISALLATKPTQADLTKVVDARASQPPIPEPAQIQP